MDHIQHKFIKVQGLNLHIAETGTGPNVVVFLHGFREIWYSWRHQMVAVANAGFRAIAPDSRGYGLSDPPAEPEKASFKHMITDLLAILDHLGPTKRKIKRLWICWTIFPTTTTAERGRPYYAHSII